MATNSLIINEDKIGFLNKQEREETFLSFYELIKIEQTRYYLGFKNVKPEDNLKVTELFIELSDNRYVYERHAYTFLELLSDFGGFNDGVLMISNSVVLFYQSKMF